MISLVEPYELKALIRDHRFKLNEIGDVVENPTTVRVSKSSLSRFLSRATVLELEAWKALSVWYQFFLHCRPQPQYETDNDIVNPTRR